MKIGIDIDGVINDLALYHIVMGTKFCYENKLHGIICPNAYKVRDMFGWEHEVERDFYTQYYMQLINTDNFLRIGACESIKKLHLNNELFLITSRREDDVPYYIDYTIEDITKNWLKENYITFDHLIFSPECKHPIINKLKLDWMIEDNPNFFKDCEMPYTKLICFNAAYNQELSDERIIRAYSWYEILDIIENTV